MSKFAKKSDINKQKLINDLITLLRKNDVTDIKSTFDAARLLEKYCTVIKQFFDELCDAPTSVSIKIISIGSEISDIENSAVYTLCRDNQTISIREPFRSNIKHTIKSNTCFSYLFEKASHNKDIYYLNNDIPNTTNYKNSSFNYYNLHSENSWALPYKSELIIPILGDSEKKSTSILGFLCIDCGAINKFDEQTHPIILQFCSDYIYRVISKMTFEKSNQLKGSVEENIDNIVESVQDSIQIFISHASMDKDFARKLCDDLQRSNFKVWFDEKNMDIGDILTDSISKGIDKSDCFLIILSPTSIKSKWVKFELDEAYDNFVTKGKKVIPLVIGELKSEEIPSRLQKHLYADFRNDYEKPLQLILRSLNKI
ncbi:MAG: toll/interleukin-1 receptor domain-containing protein [Bacteroidia bacterium]